MSTSKGISSDVFAELNAQDEVASMMEDNEVMDQLEEIGREQRGNDNKNDPTDNTGGGQEVQMGPPTESKPSHLEALLDDDSMDGGIVQGAEESFDFDPPKADAAATGFDAEFNESVVVTANKNVEEKKQEK